MTETMKVALRVIHILRLKQTWPLIEAVKSAIKTEANFVGCTIEEAADAILEEAIETQRHSKSVDTFAQWHDERMGRMRRLTSKEQRRVILGEEFVEDCPACACGNLHIKRKHNGKLFVGCDCFNSDCCHCEFSFAVPEQFAIPQSAEMTEIERAKALIAVAPRCINHGVPMTGRIGQYGLFSCCTVKGCTYRKSLKTTELLDNKIAPAETR